MNRCQKCQGLMEKRHELGEGIWFMDIVCANCGWRLWPQEILDQRAIARAVFFANSKARKMRNVAY